MFNIKKITILRNYVEIIHTNGWTLGFGEPLGQADFYRELAIFSMFFI